VAAMVSRNVTEPNTPTTGISVAAIAPPNWTETMDVSTSRGAGTRRVPWDLGVSDTGRTDDQPGPRRP